MTTPNRPYWEKSDMLRNVSASGLHFLCEITLRVDFDKLLVYIGNGKDSGDP